MSIADRSSVLFARQPILDSKLRLVGFELLFRDSDMQTAAPAIFDGDMATSRVLVNAFFQDDIETICSHRPAFVNFTANTLDPDLPFAPDRLVIEVLEDVVPTPSIIETLITLHERGFRIALDDFGPEDIDHPLLDHADIIKLEYPQFDNDSFRQTISALRSRCPSARILAEKIETQAEFTICRDAGCDLFQGYFLARPQSVSGSSMSADHTGLLHLLARLNDPGADLDEISRLLASDPFLSLRVLTLVNSAAYGNRREITSLQRAVFFLGLSRIRSLASLIILSKMQNKPHALYQIAVTRSVICQRLCRELSVSDDMGFITGLLSCLDAILDRPLIEILDRTAFDPQISAALLDYEGPLGVILKAVLTHERGDFDAIAWAELAELGITPACMMSAFRDGIAVANEQSRMLS